MLEKYLSIWSFVGIFPENEVDEAFDLRRSHFQDSIFRDDLVQIIAILYHERVVLRDHLIGQWTEGPDVALHVVSLSLEDLGREIERGSANCLPKLAWLVNRPSEVTNFCHSLSLHI